MSKLTEKSKQEIVNELQGQIFKVPFSENNENPNGIIKQQMNIYQEMLEKNTI